MEWKGGDWGRGKGRAGDREPLEWSGVGREAGGSYVKRRGRGREKVDWEGWPVGKGV